MTILMISILQKNPTTGEKSNEELDPTSQKKESEEEKINVGAERKRKRSNSPIPSRLDIDYQPSGDEKIDENEVIRLASSNRRAPTKMIL